MHSQNALGRVETGRHGAAFKKFVLMYTVHTHAGVCACTHACVCVCMHACVCMTITKRVNIQLFVMMFKQSIKMHKLITSRHIQTPIKIYCNTMLTEKSTMTYNKKQTHVMKGL